MTVGFTHGYRNLASLWLFVGTKPDIRLIIYQNLEKSFITAFSW